MSKLTSRARTNDGARAASLKINAFVPEQKAVSFDELSIDALDALHDQFGLGFEVHAGKIVGLNFQIPSRVEPLVFLRYPEGGAA